MIMSMKYFSVKGYVDLQPTGWNKDSIQNDTTEVKFIQNIYPCFVTEGDPDIDNRQSAGTRGLKPTNGR